MYQQTMYGTPMGGMPQQPFNPGMAGYWPNQTGMAYAPRPAPRMTQPVTPELSKMLHESSDVLDIRIKNTDKIRSWCTHKEPSTGRFALVPVHPEDPKDTKVRCTVCGEEFDLVYLNQDEVKEIVESCISLIQTIKTAYVDMPEEFIKSYMVIIYMLRKIIDLYPQAMKNFATYEMYTGQVYPNQPGINTWQMANQILSGFNPMAGVAPMGYPPQTAQQPYPYGMANPWSTPASAAQTAPNSGVWAQPPMSAPAVPMVDAWGNVIQQPASAVTTQQGQPMAPGFNPLMATGNPGAMSAPAPTGPAPAQMAQTAPNQQPTQAQQTKTMTV